MGHGLGFLFFFGVHANCPNFVPFKNENEREIKKKKQTKKDMRI